jgi:hypothetical protein
MCVRNILRSLVLSYAQCNITHRLEEAVIWLLLYGKIPYTNL